MKNSNSWEEGWRSVRSLKMEMAVQAGVSGKVAKVGVAKGDKVEGEDLMMEIEE